MDVLLGILIVFVSSVVELWLSIPLGLAFDLNPFLIVAASTLGSVFAVFFVAGLGERLRNWVIKNGTEQTKILEMGVSMIYGRSMVPRGWDCYLPYFLAHRWELPLELLWGS